MTTSTFCTAYHSVQTPHGLNVLIKFTYGKQSSYLFGCFRFWGRWGFNYYFEEIDLITNCVQNQFNQPGYRACHSLEILQTNHARRRIWMVVWNFFVPFIKATLTRSFCACSSKSLLFILNDSIQVVLE